jgi:hypothetical protein
MKIKCVKNTSKTVKGYIYEVLQIQNNNANNQRYFRSFVKIKINEKVIGMYSPSNFTNLDGTPISMINWSSDDYKSRGSVVNERLNLDQLKKGDLVVCQYSTTILETTKIYKVEAVRPEAYKIKIQGSNRWLSSYRFRQLNAQEKREMSLGGIFDEVTLQIEDVDKTKKVRRIDRLTEVEKRKMLLSFLFESMIDRHRNNMTIVEWAANKRASGWGVTENDYKDFLNKKLSDIIKLCE